jgi:hypothetical protein
VAKKQMSAAEFAAMEIILRISKLSDAKIKMARTVLLDGASMADTARVAGCTRQNVAGAVDIVWTCFEIYKSAKLAEAEFKIQ